MQQRSPEWYSAKLGKVGASCISDIMAETKSGPSASRKNYMMKLLCERLTGRKEDGYINAAMQRGIDLEPIARSAYEAQGAMVQEVGFIPCPLFPDKAGASPDGLVGNDGLIEIKCMNTAQHVEFLRTSKIDSGYELQMLFQMVCTGREWCDFISFDDRLPVDLQYKCVRFHYDKVRAGKMLIAVTGFIEELDALEAEMRARQQSQQELAA